MLLLMATAGVTLLAEILWLRSHRPRWGRIALGTPLVYGVLLVIVTAHLRVMNDARRVALASHDLQVELMRGDSTVQLVPEGADLATPIPAGESREVTVAFAATGDGATPTLRVTEGIGVDRVIEGALLGDDDALRRVRVKLGL
jgi:hypothetical protein